MQSGNQCKNKVSCVFKVTHEYDLCVAYATQRQMIFLYNKYLYTRRKYSVFPVFRCRSQLAKTKIDSGTDNEKKDDSGNETGAGEGEPEEEPEIVHYDKSKSFFDNISCEAVERSKGQVFNSVVKHISIMSNI